MTEFETSEMNRGFDGGYRHSVRFLDRLTVIRRLTLPARNALKSPYARAATDRPGLSLAATVLSLLACHAQRTTACPISFLKRDNARVQGSLTVDR